MTVQQPGESGSAAIPCFVVAGKGYVWDADGTCRWFDAGRDALQRSGGLVVICSWDASRDPTPPTTRHFVAGALRLRKRHRLMGCLIGGVSRKGRPQATGVVVTGGRLGHGVAPHPPVTVAA